MDFFKLEKKVFYVVFFFEKKWDENNNSEKFDNIFNGVKDDSIIIFSIIIIRKI